VREGRVAQRRAAAELALEEAVGVLARGGGFLKGELGRREALRYPPFSHLIRIVCSATAGQAVGEAARAIRTQLGDIPGAQVLGPAPLFRLRGRERAQLVIKGTQRAIAVRAAGAAVAEVAGDRTRRGVAFSVDVDPQ